MPTSTTTYGLSKPTVGGDADVWGGYCNTNFDKIDAMNRSITGGGSANAHTLTSGLSLSAYATGQKFSFTAGATNTAAATLNVDSIGAKNIYLGGSPLRGGEIVSGQSLDVVYDGTQFQIVGGAAVANKPNVGEKGMLWGLTLSNNGSDATNDIDIAVGTAIDGTNAVFLTLGSALTKQLDVTWAVGTNAGGLDTGSIANTTYHVWLIMRSDTGVVDALFSTSATSPTMPANYDYKRRIGSILREGAAIVGFVQDGDLFMRKLSIQDINATNPGTSAVTRTLSVPTGVRVEAILSIALTSTTTSTLYGALMSDLSLADDVASGFLNQVILQTQSTAGVYRAKAGANVMTNTSAQVRSRLGASDALTVLSITTFGWRDLRGRTA